MDNKMGPKNDDDDVIRSELNEWIRRLEDIRAALDTRDTDCIARLWQEASERPLFGNKFRLLFEDGYKIQIRCELELLHED